MKNKKIQFANLVCRSGQYTLLDMFKAIIHPSFFGENLLRTYKNTTFIFHEPKLVKLWDSEDHSGLAIIGRIVKDEIIRIEQKLTDGELRQASDTIQNSPSSVFILFLNNHRLAYVREHSRAPSLQVFCATLDCFVKKIYNTRLQEKTRIIRSAHPRNKWRELINEFTSTHPRPTIDLIELSDSRNISDVVLGMSSVRKLSFDVIRTNDEINTDSLFQSVRDEKINLGNPSTAVVNFSDPKSSLDISESARLVTIAADDQNVNFTISGKSNGNDVKYSNKAANEDGAEQVTITSPLNNENQTPLQIAKQAAKEFRKFTELGVISKPKIANEIDVIRKLASIESLYL